MLSPASAGLLVAHWEVEVTVMEVSQEEAAFSALEGQRNGGPGDRLKD